MRRTFNIHLLTALLFIIWTILISLSGFKDVSAEKEKTLALARHEAMTTFNKDQAARLWSTEHGGVYVPISPKTPPNPYLSHVQDRDITTPGGLRLTLMNPAYMIRQIMKDYELLYEIKGHITSLKPLNPDNVPDAWERKTLEEFEKKDIKEAYEIDRSEPEICLRFMRPMITTEGCLKCHAVQGYKVGDLRGGVGVKLPLARHLAIENTAINHLIIEHSILWAIGTIGLGIFTVFGKRRITEQLLAQKRLTDANEELKKALDEVKTLRGIIPICIYCKKIRDDKGLWNQLEAYIHSHSGAEFSHCACPECFKKQMENIDQLD